jgi:hypothetical protein
LSLPEPVVTANFPVTVKLSPRVAMELVPPPRKAFIPPSSTSGPFKLMSSAPPPVVRLSAAKRPVSTEMLKL